jgi:glucokinase
MDAIIGVDVGHTTVSGGLVSPEGEVLAVRTAPTYGDGPGTAVETVLDVIAWLHAEARDRGLALMGVGIGLPGVVDVERGLMADTAAPWRDLAGAPLVERAGALTGLPVFVDNDVNALALGELYFGAGRGASTIVLLAAGTGVGGAIIVDGRVLRGRSGYAGEFGHVPLGLQSVHGLQCPCGACGCLCAYLGGKYVEQRAREEVDAQSGSSMLALAGGDPEAITAESVFMAAAAADPAARRIVDEACDALGRTLAIILNGLDPDVVVITGGIATSLLPLRAEVLRCVRRHLPLRPLEEDRIQIVPGDKRRTARGGAALVLYELARGAVDKVGRGATPSPCPAPPVPSQ